MPLTINQQEYHIAISLHSQDDYIVSPALLPHKKKHKGKKAEKAEEAVMHVWSLEGYTL